MITGYNTDVEFGGVTYHVQTEDKGLQTPIILSLVYAGGEILAAKRSPYDDLVAGGFDEKVLVSRLQRQHKLICAAVHAGRLEDLKRMSEREAAPPKPAPAAETEAPTIETRISDAMAAGANDEGLSVRLLDQAELRGGQTVLLEVLVTRAARGTRQPAANVPVLVKTLGSTFSPQSIKATTDERGVASVSVSLPEFSSGRAAILIKANDAGETGETRRIILPSS